MVVQVVLKKNIINRRDFKDRPIFERGTGRAFETEETRGAKAWYGKIKVF